ncbi:hypothetical protein O181_106733 [Austropuccinia psidii MF-1]|uniref:Uncharacterized protein n=1 Tax=Austropuccinia psidii MF-1 TaxID=1389203 RepID=A0A9Q3PM83_9BASI|nr:hypothetical protein [Austropuccinia psidii MF-1]
MSSLASNQRQAAWPVWPSEHFRRLKGVFETKEGWTRPFMNFELRQPTSLFSLLAWPGWCCCSSAAPTALVVPSRLAGRCQGSLQPVFPRRNSHGSGRARESASRRPACSHHGGLRSTLGPNTNHD